MFDFVELSVPFPHRSAHLMSRNSKYCTDRFFIHVDFGEDETPGSPDGNG